ESFLIERDDRRARGLCAPYAADAGMRESNAASLTRNKTEPLPGRLCLQVALPYFSRRWTIMQITFVAGKFENNIGADQLITISRQIIRRWHPPVQKAQERLQPHIAGLSDQFTLMLLECLVLFFGSTLLDLCGKFLGLWCKTKDVRGLVPKEHRLDGR